MAARRPFWKRHHWKSIGFCLWPPSTCIWGLKLKFQSKLDLCSGNHVVYRQTDGRTDGQTDKVNPVYPPSNFVGRGYNDPCAQTLIHLTDCATRLSTKKWNPNCHQTSNISPTKSQNLNVSRIVLQLPLPNSLKSSEWNIVGADGPTTSERSTISLPTKVRLILKVWWYTVWDGDNRSTSDLREGSRDAKFASKWAIT